MVAKIFLVMGEMIRADIKRAHAKGRIPLPNRMNFWKSDKGGGVIFNPKIYIAVQRPFGIFP